MAQREAAELLAHYGTPIRPFLDDPAVTEICVNAWNDIWVETAGRLTRTTARWSSETELVTFIKQVANALGQEVDEHRRPLLDARFDNGTRLNATLRPIAVFGPCVSIRPFPKTVFSLDDLLRFGAVTPAMVEVFRLAVLGRLNVLVSGGTGSGKTTLLRCFCRFVPDDERTITIEDTAENLLPDHPHRLSFEAPKRLQAEGALPVTMGLLIENALRQRPDRIIVGEIRSAEAAAAFVDAINTGHAGTMSTVHANGAVDALARLDVLYARQAANFSMEVVRALIRGNIDLVVHAVRESDGEATMRRVKEVVWIENHRPVPLIRHRRGEGHVGDDDAICRFRRHLADRT